MKPAFTISANPARISLRGRVSSSSRSQSTAAGAWNAPTRFLPSFVLMPVLPPTAASTMPSTVVGTCTTRTPRSQVAATKPARSVIAPPPRPTTASLRVKSAWPRICQQNAATSTRLPASASGTSASSTSNRSWSSSRSAAALAPSVGACTTSTLRDRRAERVAELARPRRDPRPRRSPPRRPPGCSCASRLPSSCSSRKRSVIVVDDPRDRAARRVDVEVGELAVDRARAPRRMAVQRAEAARRRGAGGCRR